jgi:hypothetical protein
MLPQTVHQDLECVFCEGTKLVSAHPRRGYKPGPPHCPVCGHRQDESCSCGHCLAAATDARRKIEARKREIVKQRFQEPEKSNRDLRDLSLQDAVYLLSLFRHSVSEDLALAKPYGNTREPLAPTADLRTGIVNRLLALGHIAISADTKLDAFVFNDELTDCPQYYPANVDWLFLPGLTADEKKEYMAEVDCLAREGPWPDAWLGEIQEMWHAIAKGECLEYYQLMLQQRGYEAEFGEKAHAVFDELLGSFSVGQTFNLTWQAARDTSDYIVKMRLQKTHARNTFIGAIQRKADRARRTLEYKDVPSRLRLSSKRPEQCVFRCLPQSRKRVLAEGPAAFPIRPRPNLPAARPTVRTGLIK